MNLEDIIKTIQKPKPMIDNHKNIQFEIIAKNKKERFALAQEQMEWNKLADKLKEVEGMLCNLQKQILDKVEKDRRKMGADLCYWQDVRTILGEK